MGHNATVVVMVDALDMISKDPEFGKKLAEKIIHVAAYQHMDNFRYSQGDISANVPNGGVHCNAATVVEVHHADQDVYVRVGQNWAEVMEYDWRKSKLPQNIILHPKGKKLDQVA